MNDNTQPVPKIQPTKTACPFYSPSEPTQQGKKRIVTPQKKIVWRALIILAFILSIITTAVVTSSLEYTSGYSNGTHDGYRIGHTDGLTQGYQSGYNVGQTQAISTWVYKNCSSYPFLLLDPHKYMACSRLQQ